MRRLATILVTIAVALSVSVGTAHAGDLEEKTRRQARIPASVVYDPSYDRFTPGTVLRPEGIHCFTGQATKRARILGKRVPKGRLVQYCTDRYVDERRAGRTFVRYLRYSTLNAAEQADRDRRRTECLTRGGVFDVTGRYDCTLPDGSNGDPDA